MRRYYCRTVFWAAGAVFLTLAGCTIKKKGTAFENQAPTAFFSPIPIENSVFSSPGQFFWFASDPDGYIVEFQFSVQLESVVRASVRDSSGKPMGTPADFVARNTPDNYSVWRWDTVSNLTQNGQIATIPLPATPRLNDTLYSVLFIRARDDQGAFSNVAWRRYGRQNRAPRTQVGTINGFFPPFPFFYSRDSLTFTDSLQVGHNGITITWSASDSLDYPKGAPDSIFTFFWELFGPYEREGLISLNPLDSSKLWASSDRPDHYNPDSTRPRFVRDRSTTFFSLKGFDTLANFKPGAYLFRVRARDDANAVDTNPNLSTTRFSVISPRFDRKVLILRKRTGLSSPTGEPTTAAKDLSQGYYFNLLRLAGYTNDIDSLQDVVEFAEQDTPPDSLLARHKLVICHKEDIFPTQAFQLANSLRRYMDAGGSVWMLGRDDLIDQTGLGGGILCPPRKTGIEYDRTNPANGVAFFYFGVEAMFNDCHIIRVFSGDSISAEEFIGADSASRFNPNTDLPKLDIDTNVVKAYVAVLWRKSATPYYQRIPGVNFFQRATRSEPLYLFNTPFSDTSHVYGKVVALRAERGAFKTAMFGFSLYGIREPQAAILMRKMLEWFVGPPS